MDVSSICLRAVAIWLAFGTAAFAAPCAPGTPGLEGSYVLNGEMEVGSQLLLRPDGQFEFMLAYGAIDQYGRGCWSIEGAKLLLRVKGRQAVPLQHSPADRRFRGMVLILEQDGRLSWPLPGFRGKFDKE